jgi:hypothetical protein
MIYQEFMDADYRIFGLYQVIDGVCQCGRKDCPAAGKHPVSSAWQHTPDWSDDQVEVMEISGQLGTGYGVLCQGLLVVDVDERNGGSASYARLVADIPEIAGAGLIVKTGSGGESKHLYFKIPTDLALLQHHNLYDGIDFKSSGFVVGPGSMHKSGNKYKTLVGAPADIGHAPDGLLKLLEKPTYYRTTHNGHHIDMSIGQIQTMLDHIDNGDVDYDFWILIGMAIHQGTGGTGYDLWDIWSQKSSKYNPAEMERKWHSFGKSATPVTIGTLIHHAELAGWQAPGSEVTFVSTVHFDYVEGVDDDIDVSSVDLKRPPGFVGEICAWINSQCLYLRENLAVASALVAVGNLCGLRYKDDHDNMSTNLLAFCVSGSSTGKEAVQQAYMRIMREAGLTPALHGAMKSEQEVIRNLLRHQMATYMIDELGITLKKVINSQKHGGASYLEGMLGLFMSAYSKATGYMPVSGDVREEVRKILVGELQQCRKKIDECDDKTGRYERRIPQIERALEHIEHGLENPFLSIIGFTTPVTFNAIADFEQATNGFLSRALIFNELETNPERKKGFVKPEMPERLALKIYSLARPGEFSHQKEDRIEYFGDKIRIITTKGAASMLDIVYQKFWEMADQHKGQTGLEAIPRRGYELCAKISTILAAPGGVREEEHVRYAYKLAMVDVEGKLTLAYANLQDQDKNVLGGITARVMACISVDHGETLGVIVNRCRPHKKEAVEKGLALLIDAKHIVVVEEEHPKNKKMINRYFSR